MSIIDLKGGIMEKYAQDPKKTGITALALGIISFFIFPAIGIGAAVIGTFGAYSALKAKKRDNKILLLNVVAIVVGIAGYAAAQLVRSSMY